MTGGKYKVQITVHRSVLIYDYFLVQLHVGEFQPTIRTEGTFEASLPIARLHPFGVPIVAHLEPNP